MRCQELRQFSRHCSEAGLSARDTIDVKVVKVNEKERNGRVRVVGIITKQRLVVEQLKQRLVVEQLKQRLVVEQLKQRLGLNPLTENWHLLYSL